MNEERKSGMYKQHNVSHPKQQLQTFCMNMDGTIEGNKTQKYVYHML